MELLFHSLTAASKKTIETLEYLSGMGSDFVSWARESIGIEQIINKNIDMIKKHPLLPKTVSVYGFIASTETRGVEAVV